MADPVNKKHRILALISGISGTLVTAGVMFFVSTDECASPREGFGKHKFISKENPWFSVCDNRVYALLDEKVAKVKFTLLPNEKPDYFRVLSPSFALGDKGVYYISQGELFGNALYLFSQVDNETFTVDDERHAHDANNAYYFSGGKLVVSSKVNARQEKFTFNALRIE